jgi:hypothetical protein
MNPVSHSLPLTSILCEIIWTTTAFSFSQWCGSIGIKRFELPSPSKPSKTDRQRHKKYKLVQINSPHLFCGHSLPNTHQASTMVTIGRRQETVPKMATTTMTTLLESPSSPSSVIDPVVPAAVSQSPNIRTEPLASSSSPPTVNDSNQSNSSSNNISSKEIEEAEEVEDTKRCCHHLYLYNHPRQHQHHRRSCMYSASILFEDGMEFVECELYYALHDETINEKRSPKTFLSTSRLQCRTAAAATTTNPFIMPCGDNEHRHRSLPSCLKSKTKYQGRTNDGCELLLDCPASTTTEQQRVRRRRFSFSGVSNYIETSIADYANRGGVFTVSDDDCCERSQSRRSLDDNDLFLLCTVAANTTTQIRFHPKVQVVSIPSVRDYPKEMKSKVWMSRQELYRSMASMKAMKKAEQKRRRNAVKAWGAAAAELAQQKLQLRELLHHQQLHPQKKEIDNSDNNSRFVKVSIVGNNIDDEDETDVAVAAAGGGGADRPPQATAA